MSLVPHPQLEQHLETWALPMCLPAAFNRCLITCGIDPTIQVTTVKGTSILIDGSDIADTRTWKKFLQSFTHEKKSYSLSEDGPALAELYYQWLLHKHTARYREITLPAHHSWLKRVTLLVVVRFLMWHKYERYAAGERDTIIDPWVANQLHQLWLLREATKDLPRLVHHIVDDPKLQRELIEQFNSTLDARIRTHVLVEQRSLPTLPQGISHPFLLLAEHRESDHE